MLYASGAHSPFVVLVPIGMVVLSNVAVTWLASKVTWSTPLSTSCPTDTNVLLRPGMTLTVLPRAAIVLLGVMLCGWIGDEKHQGVQQLMGWDHTFC